LNKVNVGKLEGAVNTNTNVQQDQNNQNTSSGVVARRKRRETVFADPNHTRPPILVSSK